MPRSRPICANVMADNRSVPEAVRGVKAKRRLAEIKAWRARMIPPLGGKTLKRNDPRIAGETPDEPIVVFQHTIDDYDFLLAENERLQKEVAAVNSARNIATNERNMESGLTHFREEATKLGLGVVKLREQHALDKKYILGLKAEIRRLKGLLPPDTPLEVIGVRFPGCATCGCPDPSMDHQKFKATVAKIQLRLDKMREMKLRLGLKYSKAVGQRRALEARLKAGAS